MPSDDELNEMYEKPEKKNEINLLKICAIQFNFISISILFKV